MTLAAKMASVMAEMEGIPKSGHNSGLNYDFITADDVAIAIRKSMSRNGIAFYASMPDSEQTAKVITYRNGGTREMIKTVAHFEFTLVDTENTDDRETCLWRGEALDDQDKGHNKAITAAKKTFLIATFLLSSGDLSEEPGPVEDVDDYDVTGGGTPPLEQGLKGKGEPIDLASHFPRQEEKPASNGMDYNALFAHVKATTVWTSLKQAEKAIGKPIAEFSNTEAAIAAIDLAAQHEGKTKS